MKKIIKKIILFTIVVCMLMFCFACGESDNGGKNGDNNTNINDTTTEAWLEEIINTGLDYGQDLKGGIASTEDTLVVDLHTHMPTTDGTVSATKTIANEFYKLTGIKVRYVSDKDLKGESAEVSEWLIKKVQNEKMPAISFTFSKFTDRDYYIVLDEILKTPNQFTEVDELGHECWKDMFYDYLWTQEGQINARNEIIAVPITLSPGTATCWFYNKSIFKENGINVPNNFSEFLEQVDKLKGKEIIDSDGKTSTLYPIAPYQNQLQINANNWINRFSIGPSFANYLVLNTDIDLDGDGKLSEFEGLIGVLKGYFDPKNGPYKEVARDYYRVTYEYYTQYLSSGWINVDWQTKWNQGTVAMINNGVWQFTNEFNNEAVHENWDFGMFPSPLVDSKTSQYATDFEMSDGPTNSNSVFFLNLMKDGIKGNKTVLKNAILFLQFLTTVDCIDLIIQEHGAELGSVKGSTPDEKLSTYWLNQKFPVVPEAIWPDAYVTSCNNYLNANFSQWINGIINDDAFYSAVSQYQKQGAIEYLNNLKIDYSEYVK